jgi:hypothetical protein
VNAINRFADKALGVIGWNNNGNWNFRDGENPLNKFEFAKKCKAELLRASIPENSDYFLKKIRLPSLRFDKIPKVFEL